MKKNILALLILLLTVNFLNAQSKDMNDCEGCKGDFGFVNFLMGPSIPIGNFADKSLTNSNAGFADVGSKVELNAGIHLTPVISANFKAFYSVNGFDIASYTSALSQNSPGTVWKTAGRSYDIYGGLLGLSYSYPGLGKFVADFKAMGGLMQISSSAFSVSNNIGESLSGSNFSATSFAYMISMGGYNPIGNLIDLTGSLEYLGSKPEMQNNNFAINTPPKSATSTNTVNTSLSNVRQDVSLLTINLGVRLKF